MKCLTRSVRAVVNTGTPTGNDDVSTKPVEDDDVPEAPGNEKFQFIHITDTHGWVFGHPHDERYNTDLGDFSSLMEHLLVQEDKEVLLFDSGDIIDGTGFSDVTSVHGEKIFPIFERIPGFGALTIGNHGR